MQEYIFKIKKSEQSDDEALIIRDEFPGECLEKFIAEYSLEPGEKLELELVRIVSDAECRAELEKLATLNHDFI